MAKLSRRTRRALKLLITGQLIQPGAGMRVQYDALTGTFIVSLQPGFRGFGTEHYGYGYFETAYGLYPWEFEGP